MSEINFEPSQRFEPFQKVLVRKEEDQIWIAALFSHRLKCKGIENLLYVTCNGLAWKFCIPYEGNEYLLGTTDNLPELEFEFGDRVEVSYDQENWLPAIFYKVRASHHRARFCVLRPTGTCSWPYCRKAS